MRLIERKESTAAALKTFGEANPPYFRGNRKDLEKYLSENFYNIRNAFVINHKDGVERDWFFMFSTDLLQKWLLERGFTWEVPINIIYINCEKKKDIRYQAPRIIHGHFTTELIKDESERNSKEENNGNDASHLYFNI